MGTDPPQKRRRRPSLTVIAQLAVILGVIITIIINRADLANFLISIWPF